MMMFALLSLTLMAASSTMIVSSGLHAARNHRGATQVHFAAESAITEVLQVIGSPGIIDFNSDVVTSWSTLYGTAARTFGPVNGFTYTVTPSASATDPANRGSLVATATGPDGERNVVVANVVRSNVPSTAPGVIYLATDAPTQATFDGDSFQIDGNDRNYTGGAGPAPAVPGISTRNDANNQATVNSLSSGQKDNVTGAGFQSGPPTVPSVMTSAAAPTVAQLDQLANDLLAKPGVVTYNGDVHGNTTLGTTAAPQITRLTSPDGTSIKANGNASGAGILIVEGDFKIEGNFDFIGLIIVRGASELLAGAHATLYGSIWAKEVRLVVGGNLVAQYSTQALGRANEASGGGALPAPVVVTSLADCAQLPAGAGGCS